MNFRHFLKAVKGKKVLILTHAGADVDGFCAAASLCYGLKGRCKPSIGVPEHINIQAKNVSKKLKIPFKIDPNLKGFDAIILVDLNDPKLLGRIRNDFLIFKNKKPVFVVDHHTKHGRITSKENSLIEEDAVSSTELVYKLFNQLNIKITPKLATLIALGIVTDSAGFFVADYKAFEIMGEVLKKSKKSYSEILKVLSSEISFGEKIAKLKAGKRASIYKLGNHVIVTSKVGSYESSSAMSLVKIGADIAFVGDIEKGEFMVSGRANNYFVKKTGFDLAKDVMIPLENYFEGQGGGHAGAAAFNGKAKAISNVLDKCLELTRIFFSKKNKKIQFKDYTN